MVYSRSNVSALLRQLGPRQALCAFNVENFDTLHPALRAAGDLSAPVVIALTVPAARYLRFDYMAQAVDLAARKFGATYALHLDHCESPNDLREAISAGFTSANFLNESAMDDETYLERSLELRKEFDGTDSALEFVLGTLGHHHDEASPHQPTVDEIVKFSQLSRPDILGFHCGSIHGMRQREKIIDTALIAAVASETGLPIVLHGSSGVREQQILAGIDAGIRKINIETAIRTVFMETIRNSVSSDGPAATKPRYLTMATDEALNATYRSYLMTYTLRD